MVSKSKNYLHSNYSVIPKSFDSKTGILMNVLDGFSVINQLESDSPIYSVIFEIPGYDFSEIVADSDRKFYVDRVFDLLEHLVLEWNIIGVNKTIDLTSQINFWTKRLDHCKEGEYRKAEVCQRNRENFLNFARYYQEPFDFLEVFSRNKEALIQLHQFLPQSKEIKIRKIVNLEEVKQIKRAVLNPLGSK